ncbi:MAG: PAS domain-containing protein [Planctomycetales bacterium]|nr:PAS domain-containing protein [Planctomycetales bacterium]
MRQNSDLLQAVLDGTSDAIFVKDVNGKFLFINRTGAQLLGKSIDEVIGLYDLDLYGSQAVAEIRSVDEKVVNEGVSFTFEQPGALQASDQTFLLTKCPYRDADGKILGVMGIARDISPQKRAAEVLAESARRFSTLANNSPTGIYETDADGNFIYVNNKCCELHEISREQMLQGEVWKVIHPEDSARIAAEWKKFIASDETYFRVDCRLLFADQRIKYTVGTSIPLFDEQGNKTGFIGNVEDVTEQRQASFELERRTSA